MVGGSCSSSPGGPCVWLGAPGCLRVTRALHPWQSQPSSAQELFALGDLCSLAGGEQGWGSGFTTCTSHQQHFSSRGTVLVAAGAPQCRLCSHSPVHPRPCPCFIYLCLSRSIIQIKHGRKNVRESSNLFITHFTPIKISIKAAWF